MNPLVFFNTLLHHGIGPIVASGNPALYPFFAAALLTSVILLLIHVGVSFAVARMTSYDVGEYAGNFAKYVGLGLLFLLAELVLITLAWIGFTSPLDILPVVHPPVSATWLAIVPAAATYNIVSVLLHGALGFVALNLLFGLWRYRFGMGLGFLALALDISLKPLAALVARFESLLILVPLAFDLYAWESQRWPLPFVIFAEMILLVGMCAYAVRVVVGPADFLVLRGRMRLFRLHAAVVQMVVIAAAIYIWFFHPISVTVALLFGVYFILSLFDDLGAAIIGAFVASDDVSFTFLTPQRWPLVTAVVLAVTLLGAAGAFNGFLPASSTLTYIVWVEAGTAALAYVLFRPLTDRARYHLYEAVRSEAERKVLIKIQQAYSAFDDIDNTRLLLSSSVSAGLPALPAPSTTATATATATATVEGTLQEAHRIRGTGRDESMRAFRGFGFPALIVFVIGLVSFYYLAESVILPANMSFQLVSTLSPVFLGAFNAAASRGLPPKVYSLSRLLLLLTVLVVSLTVAVTYVSSGDSSLLATAAPGAQLHDPTFWIVTIRLMLIEFSLLLLAGHLLYLIRILLTNFMLGKD